MLADGKTYYSKVAVFSNLTCTFKCSSIKIPKKFLAELGKMSLAPAGVGAPGGSAGDGSWEKDWVPP